MSLWLALVLQSAATPSHMLDINADRPPSAAGLTLADMLDVPLTWKAPAAPMAMQRWVLDRNERGRTIRCEDASGLTPFLRGGAESCAFWTNSDNRVGSFVRNTRKGERVRFVFTHQTTRTVDPVFLPTTAEVLSRQFTIRALDRDRCLFLMPDGGAVVGPDRTDCGRARSLAEIDRRLGGGDRQQMVRTLIVEPLASASDEPVPVLLPTKRTRPSD